MTAPLPPGQQLIDGNIINQLLQTLFGYQDGITAHAGGGQGSAVQLSAGLNYISVVASAGDSVKMPPAIPNPTVGVAVMFIRNAGAQSCNVYPASGDQINEGGANTAFALSNGKSVVLFCAHKGEWSANLTA